MRVSPGSSAAVRRLPYLLAAPPGASIQHPTRSRHHLSGTNR